MLRLNPSLLHRLQQYLLFLLFWSYFSGSLSFINGLVLFLILDFSVSLGLLKSALLPIPRWISRSAFLLSTLLLFPLIRLANLPASLLPAPYNLLPLQLFYYLLPVLPFVLLAHVLRGIAGGGRGRHYGVLFVYLITLAFLISRPGWRLILPLDKLWTAYGALFLFLTVQILLVMSGGEKGRLLRLFPGLLLVLLIPLTALLPLSRYYRNESRKEGGGLLESSLFRFDFSDFLSLESSISMKDDLVFLMRREGPGEDLLVRRFVLSEYSDEQGFFRMPGGTPEAPGRLQDEFLIPESPRYWEEPDYELSEKVMQEYFLVNFDSSAFLGLNTPVSVTPFQNWDRSSFSRIYRVDSLVSQAWGWDLFEAEFPVVTTPDEQSFYDYYTHTGSRNNLLELANQIVTGKEGYYEQVKAIEEYMQLNYHYSLHPGEAAGGDQLNYFLFESRKGYCSYFAFSMALLCRNLNIPARVALGFWVDGSGSVLNYYPVKANQAHAWVEVYFPGYGWIEFDPTSQTPAPGEEYQFAPFSTEEMEPYLKEILENRGTLVEAGISDEESPDTSDRKGGGLFNNLSYFQYALLILVLISLLLILHLVFRIRLLSRPLFKTEKATKFYHLHMTLFESLAGGRKKGESFQEYSLRLDPEGQYGLAGFTSQFERIRFGWSSLDDRLSLSEQGRSIRRALYAETRRLEKIRYPFILMKKLRRYR